MSIKFSSTQLWSLSVVVWHNIIEITNDVKRMKNDVARYFTYIFGNEMKLTTLHKYVYIRP